MKILDTKLIHSTPYIHLYERSVDHNGSVRPYFFATRNKNLSNEHLALPNAVIVVGFVNDKLVLTSEFRIPIATREIGFPAGIIDAKDFVGSNNWQDAAKKSAIREFTEETGLSFVPNEVSPLLCSSAGMTDESVCVVHGTASGTVSDEFLESSEDIQALLLSEQELVRFMSHNKYPYGKHAWAMLWAFSQFGYPNWA